MLSCIKCLHDNKSMFRDVIVVVVTSIVPLQAQMKFPVDYPYSPPKLRFLSPILHPNVYTVRIKIYRAECILCDEIVINAVYGILQDGELCISILHPPGEDPHSGEKPEERWNPTQTVR